MLKNVRLKEVRKNEQHTVRYEREGGREGEGGDRSDNMSREVSRAQSRLSPASQGHWTLRAWDETNNNNTP